MTERLPESLEGKIAHVGREIRPGDIDVYERVSAVANRRKRLEAALDAWGKQQEQDRDLRHKYATRLLIALFAQIAVAVVALFLLGFGAMTLSEWVASVFFAAVFAEVVSMTLIILRYLFRPTPFPDVEEKEAE